MGRQGSPRQDSPGRGACVWREPGASHAPPPRRFSHKDQETPDALWQEDKAQRHRFVHASACDNDESRRPTSAILWRQAKQPVFWKPCWTAWPPTWKKRKPSNQKSNLL